MDISAMKSKGKGYKGRANTKERAKAKERAMEDTKEKEKDTKVTEKVQLDKGIPSDRRDNIHNR